MGLAGKTRGGTSVRRLGPRWQPNAHLALPWPQDKKKEKEKDKGKDKGDSGAAASSTLARFKVCACLYLCLQSMWASLLSCALLEVPSLSGALWTYRALALHGWPNVA